MALLILDPKTGFASTADAVKMCIETVIPSLLPFIILSRIITASFIGTTPLFLKPIGKLCGIPRGSESLLLIGFIGGYPVGAQCVNSAYESGQITKFDAQRMLGFCNNPGPAFIFGITASLFPSIRYSWIIWGIQILSAIFVGAILPGKSSSTCICEPKGTPGITHNLEASAKTMSIICVWIIAAKIVIGYLGNWLAHLLPIELSIAIDGIIELSNGCIALREINSQQLRFIYTNCFLSFGGLCVWLQTISVTGKLNRNSFYLGKLMQTAITIIIATLLSHILFPETVLSYKSVGIVLFTALTILLYTIKKTVALRKKVLYNVKNTSRKERPYAFS